MRAIQEVVKISWNGESREFDPGAAGKGVFESGIQVPVHGMKEGTAAQSYSFAFNLRLAGSKTLSFLPLGKDTEVSLHSTWNNPSFIGSYLPANREVSDQGFSAGWKVLHLGRNYPQQWLDTEVKPDTIKESAFGVSLLFPVETYQMTTRSAKYAILFILLTFVTFFFFEIFNKIRIHAVSYLLVGFAMCLFYLLLLSLSEHLDFSFSYLAAAVATVLLVTAYSLAVLKAGGRALLMGGVLAGLYGYLYILLQLQDYALLMGAVGLFFILALIIFITRKVNWYGLTSTSAAPLEKAVAVE
jgi:inner membrane protein